MDQRVGSRMLPLVFLLSSIVFVNGLIFTPASDVVTVQCSIGTILGKLEADFLDGQQFKVKTFLGIPYAEAPVNDRRFRKPVPKANFTRSFRAFDFGPACLQRARSMTGMSEDCLYLNIFTPSHVNATSNIPVMVWFHGGWFQMGSSNDYYGDTLSAFGNVIIVTVNYRLLHLGFLRIDDTENNFGLWDQQLALKWVKNNIASFGGDVNNITIFGESAGSASVVYQAMNPANMGLFHRAIGESGSITSQWAFSTNKIAKDQFHKFASLAGCNGTHSNIMSCLRNLTSDEIFRTINNDIPVRLIVPSQDNAFVPKLPTDMLKSTPDMRQSHDFFKSLDLIMGVNSLDGAVYLPFYATFMNNTLDLTDVQFKSYFIPKILSDIFKEVPNIPDAAKNATVFEYMDMHHLNDTQARIKELVDITTDTAFVAPSVSLLRLHGNRAHGSTFFYEFATKPSSRVTYVPIFMEGPTVANHFDEVIFVFGFTNKAVRRIKLLQPDFSVSVDDIRTSKAMMSMWSNFAKSG